MDASGTTDGIGLRLKDARERAGLSLIEAAEKLHVDPRAIEALEAERFEEFGASVYVRGHIGHYAELVGESPTELQGLYAASSHAVRAPDLRRVPNARRSDPSPTPLVPGIAVVALVALVGLSWWVAGNLHGSPKVQPAADSVASVAPSSAADGIAGPATAAVSGGTVSVGRGSPPPPAQVPSASETARAALVGSSETGVGAADAAPADAAAARRAAEGHSKVSALQLHFTEDSWAEVYDARGNRLFFDVGSADSTRTVSGTPPLRVVLGNPTGVALELNGRPVGVPESATRNVSIEFQINRSGRVAPARLAAANARSEQKEPGRD